VDDNHEEASRTWVPGRVPGTGDGGAPGGGLPPEDAGLGTGAHGPGQEPARFGAGPSSWPIAVHGAAPEEGWSDALGGERPGDGSHEGSLGDPHSPVPADLRSHRRAPQWLVTAVVSAVVGAAVGAGVAEGLGAGSSSTLPAIRVGETRPGPALAGGQSIPAIVKGVLPEVVSIDAKGPATGEDQGTGMVISSAGEVITNNHVIAGATSITVTVYNQTAPLQAALVGADPTNDLALLKVDSPPADLHPVTFGDSTHLVVGDAVIAIGNALGLSAGTPTVTSGIVSALGRTVQAGDTTGSTETLSNLIQTDAAINSGNSGGPLVDSSGDVVGMNTAVASSSSGNAPAQNIGFAIPAVTIEKLITELRNGGTAAASKAYLGVYVTDETAQLQQQFSLVPSSGALIESVVPGSPAGDAGLAAGDVIVAFDGNPVGSAQDLTTAVQKASPGQSVPVTLWRGQQKLTRDVTLTSAPAR